MPPNRKKELLAHLSSRQAWILLIGYIGLMIALAIVLQRYVDRESLRAVVDNTGPFGVLIFLLIEYIYIILVPIYNTGIHIAAGYIFGGHLGLLLNFISTSAGLFTIIILVKHYGRPILSRIISKKILRRYDSLAHRIGPITLFMIYVLPLFPDDEITYLIAASGRVSFWRFILPVFLGNIAKAAVSYIGDEGLEGFPMAFGTRALVLAFGVILIGVQEILFQRYQKKLPYKHF